MAVIFAIWIFMGVLGTSSLVALVWAIQTGKFSNIKGDAMSIFDADEPIGKVTDSFPQNTDCKDGKI
ncbi:hypothetical protein Q31b_10140 [Novipirellula aureliae]|uniref:Cytochrome oxidase maturation protein cbb3-type n=2 Tax=Novipirellula aureliae TaxID=2527966 RepID=A0A5C6EAF8_9BACT|nr:hypothetical protein Q31b_10140 [Novipirellula aureliae]